MTRPERATRRLRRSGGRPGIEILEGQKLLTGISFLSGLGVVASGKTAAISSNAVATDASGDTYVTGSFRSTAAFDPSSTAGNVTTASTQDTFVAKYGPTDALIWAKTFAGQATTTGTTTTYAVSQGSAIAVDGSGNVFVAGSFNGTVNLTGTSGQTQVSSVNAANEAYVAKLDPTGHVTWFDAVTGTAYDTDSANALALDGSGGVVIAGSFADSASFGSISLAAGGSSDAFVARVNSSGGFLWAVASQGANGSNAQVEGLAVDASGNVDLAGSFSGTVDFDPSLGAAPLTSAGSVDALLWKLDPGGKFLWARSYGSTDYDTANAVAVDVSGNLYATGAFSDTVNFATPTRLDSLTAGPVYDVFVLKVDASGNEVWVKGLIGSSGSAKGQGVAVDSVGFVDVAGTFSGPLDFDPGPGLDVLTSVGNSDAFVAGYNGSGNLVYALQAGTTNFNAALGVAVNASETVAITGIYSGSTAFGPSTLPTSSVLSVFVAQVITQGPPAPSAPVLEASSDTGISQSDGYTSDTTPVFDVNTAGASNTVELLRNGIVVAHRIGPGALPDPGPLADGTYSYTATQVSPAGLVGPTGSASSVTILTVPPAAPPALTLLATDDSGTPGDGITNVNRPRLAVVANGGTTLQLLNSAGSVIGTAYQANNGTCVLAPTQALADGVYTVRARIMDVAGNLSMAGPALTLTIDTTPPAAPSILALLPTDDSGTQGDGVTNVAQARLSGRAEAGTMVTLVDGSGRIDGSAVAGIDGTFTVKINAPLADGSYQLSARATDAAGNSGPAGPSLALTILTTPPPAPSTPSILAADVTGPIGSTLTSIRQPRIVGTARAGTTVEILGSSGTVLASATVGSSGSYTAKIANPLADGSMVLDAIDLDAAGNLSAASSTLTLTIDATPPAPPSAPSLIAADDSGTLGDGLTNVRQPRLSGTAEPGSTVTLIDGNGKSYGSAIVAANGTFLAKINAPLSDGTYKIAARATDAAGNISLAGSPLTLTILATPPATPSAPTLLAQDDSGTVGDRITNVRQPRLTATVTPGSTIHLINPANLLLGTATASTTGVVTISPLTPLADGNSMLSLVAIDAAGNTSPAGPSISLTILATPPPQPIAPTLLAADDTGVLGDGMTSVRRPRIVGSAAPGGRIDWLAANGSVLASTTASASFGSYQLQLSTALPNGIVPVRVRETDVAGNISTSSTLYNLTIRSDPGDDFGDGQSDISVFRTTDGTFFVQKPTTGAAVVMQFGGAGDVPINGDFFGNGHNDIAVYRPSTSTFYLLDPVTGVTKVMLFGQAGDVPVPADYDGDGQTDFAVFRPSTSTFLIQMSTTGTTSSRPFGGSGDVPVPADYFGNGHADLAVYRPSTSTFFVYDPIGGTSKVVAIGTPGSTPVPADYEGLGHVDPAVYQSGNSSFVIQMSATNSVFSRSFGGSGDIPLPGDYFGNGRADLAIYRASTATFYAIDIPTSVTKVVAWGTPNVTRPTLAPITTWFTFGGIQGSNSILRRDPSGTSPALVDFAVQPEMTDLPALPMTTKKQKAVDRAINSLALDGWRPV